MPVSVVSWISVSVHFKHTFFQAYTHSRAHFHIAAHIYSYLAAHKAYLTSAKKENALSTMLFVAYAVFLHDRFVFFVILLFTYFTVLGMKPRASCTLSKLPPTELCFLSPF